jgi:hypothetical protein
MISPDPLAVIVTPLIVVEDPVIGNALTVEHVTQKGVDVGVGVGVGNGTVNSNVTHSGLCDASLTFPGVRDPNNDVVYGGDVCIVYNSPPFVGI